MDYVAKNAVDGEIATCTRANAIGTGIGYLYKAVWWKVDLKGVYSIYSISIFFKTYNGYGRILFSYYQSNCLCAFSPIVSNYCLKKWFTIYNTWGRFWILTPIFFSFDYIASVKLLAHLYVSWKLKWTFWPLFVRRLSVCFFPLSVYLSVRLKFVISFTFFISSPEPLGQF